MEPIVMNNLAELDEKAAWEATRVFVDGFYPNLKSFSEDKTVLVQALQHSLVRKQFFVASLNGSVVSIAAYSTNQARSVTFDKQILQRVFGKLKGWLCYKMLIPVVNKPLLIGDHQCYIESVTTAPEARGKGIATGLLEYIFRVLPHEEFILEVVDTNPTAVQLYERLGFKVMHSKKVWLFRRQAGYKERFYMKKNKLFAL